MAAYDADERKVVVRVVYDGPGFAGKTTNLRKLEEFFTERRRSGLASPGEREGRTLLFDWMHLDGGLVAGHGLRCQLVTVPGQWALRERRLHLLSTADAVVFVCEATEAGLGAARPQLDSLREHLAARAPEDVPLVLQLNKQDLPGAVEEPAARARLEVSEAMPLVAARAREGTGVRETVVLAIRAAANRVQQQLLAGGLDELGRLESRPELRAALETLAPREETAPGEAAPGEAAPGEAAPDEAAPDEAAPDEAAPGEAAPDEAAPGEAAPEGGGAVELRLAERRAPRPASAAPQAAPPARPARQPIVRPASSPPAFESRSAGPASRGAGSSSPPGSEPSAALASTSTEPRAAARASDTGRPFAPAPDAARPSAGASSDRSREVARDPSSPPDPPSVDEPEEPPEHTEVRVRPHVLADPPWPRADAASGCIWPATTGREILRAVASVGPPRARPDLVARQGMEDGSGGSDLRLFQAGAWCLKTSLRRRFDDPDAARAALLRLARAKSQLGDLLPADTVLCLSSAPKQGTWLWTVTPWMQTSRAALAAARERSADALGQELVAFADAALAAIELVVRRGVVLDVHPSNFARHRGALAYVDDDIDPGRRMSGVGHALLQRAHEYAAHPAAVERYVAYLERELPARWTRSEVERLGLVESVVPCTPRSEIAADAKRRLLAALDRCRDVEQIG